jgi:hypothetical protein
MRSLLHRLRSWWWNQQHPLWDEPDVTTPQVIADWIAANKHPAECAGGCQCGRR